MHSFTSAHLVEPFIRKLESITHLSGEERAALQSLPLTSRAFGSHQDIVRDGDSPSKCCLILQGWMFRYKLLGEGKRQILSFHVVGDVPDLMSLYVPVVDYNLCTLTPVQLVFIPHESLRDLTVRFPGINAALWRDTLTDAAIFREWMTGLGRRSAYGRIAHICCELYLKQKAVGLAGDLRCPFPITQLEIGHALGLSTVHVNRSLQELRKNRLITLGGRELVIDDWTGLQRAGEFDPTYLNLEQQTAA